MAKRSVVGRVLRRPEHVALHKVVVAAELVEIHVRGSDNPDVLAGEAPAQDEGDLLQTPAEPLGPVRLQGHLLLEGLHEDKNAHKHHEERGRWQSLFSDLWFDCFGLQQ